MVKDFEDMYNRLHSIPACDRKTGRTDRQTDVLRRHSPRYAYAWRGKNRSRGLSVLHWPVDVMHIGF